MPLRGAGLIGAVVEPVHDSIAIAIRIGATAVFWHAGYAGALIFYISNAITVVVIHTSVGVFDAIFVLGDVGAGVLVVNDAIAIAIALGDAFWWPRRQPAAALPSTGQDGPRRAALEPEDVLSGV